MARIRRQGWTKVPRSLATSGRSTGACGTAVQVALGPAQEWGHQPAMAESAPICVDREGGQGCLPLRDARPRSPVSLVNRGSPPGFLPGHAFPFKHGGPSPQPLRPPCLVGGPAAPPTSLPVGTQRPVRSIRPSPPQPWLHPGGAAGVCPARRCGDAPGRLGCPGGLRCWCSAALPRRQQEQERKWNSEAFV